MKKEALLYGAIGLAAGIILTALAASLSVNNDYRGMMRVMGMNTSRVQEKGAGHMGMSMNAMQRELQGLNGDTFDKNFLDMMIAHHQGAVAMAKDAKKQAKHDEVKRMADDILAVQSREIDMMTAWMSQWGYTEMSDPEHNMHVN